MEKNTLSISDEFQNMVILPQKEMLSFKQALDYLDVSISMLYKLTSSRLITYSKPNGGKLYFKKSDLDDWMKQNELKSIRVLENEINNHLKK
ncbi:MULTISPECIES: helix-turn-helix domain-containing protein [unclassified Flavobacterium]|uniref:helix-turn-helix domain-containing protein n=1 Tax=unclassified Flavobacterium TaxID=196869 RepID=UPI00131B159F|nr:MULTISPECIES: helix-turn-helix domain-containing protein [unclassified Flavobacterium]